MAAWEAEALGQYDAIVHGPNAFEDQLHNEFRQPPAAAVSTQAKESQR